MIQAVTPALSAAQILKKKQAKRKKCKTRNCRNSIAFRKDGRPYGARCHRCRTASWRRNQPFQSAFQRLRHHAKARDIEFTLSFEEFKAFAQCTELITRTGNDKHSLTVDRIDNLKGYVAGNIRAITRSENSIKRARQDEMRIRKGYAWRDR